MTGEAVYINDIAPAPGELYAAFALSHMGSAQLDSIDSSKAMVCRYVCFDVGFLFNIINNYLLSLANPFPGS